VIGFAFRDEYLRQIFLAFLELVKTNRIVIVSPSAKDAAKNLLGNEKGLEKQIVTIEASFGEAATLPRIFHALT
jgi:hypothetical protein